MEVSNRNFFYYFDKLLHESPNLVPDFSQDELDNMVSGKYLQGISDTYFSNPDTYSNISNYFKNLNTKEYVVVDDNKHHILFIHLKSKAVYGYATYQAQKDGGVEVLEIYIKPLFSMIAETLYRKYLLDKFKYIISSNIQTYKGKNFWERFLSEILGDSNYEAFVMDGDKKYPFDDMKEFSKFYSETNPKHDEIRFIVRKMQ